MGTPQYPVSSVIDSGGVIGYLAFLAADIQTTLGILAFSRDTPVLFGSFDNQHSIFRKLWLLGNSALF